MTLSKSMTISLLGPLMSLSSGALATRTLAQLDICLRKPFLAECKPDVVSHLPPVNFADLLPLAPAPFEPEETGGDVGVPPEGSAGSVFTNC
jgi:hypothetical protein